MPKHENCQRTIDGSIGDRKIFKTPRFEPDVVQTLTLGSLPGQIQHRGR